MPSMRRTLPIALACALLPFTADAQMKPKPLTKADYPPHTTQIIAKRVSGDTFDCTWSVNCKAGAFLLHSLPSTCDPGDISLSQATPDAPANCLGRLSGWTEGAVADAQSERAMDFVVFASTYDNAIDAEGSAQDFVDMAQGRTGFQLAKEQPNMEAGSDLGGSAILVSKSHIPHGVNAYLALCFTGEAEVEASATWVSGSRTQSKALHWLVKLAEKALAYQLANP